MTQIKLLEAIFEDIKKQIPGLIFSSDDLTHIINISYSHIKFRSIIKNNCIWLQQSIDHKISYTTTDSGVRRLLQVDIADPKSIDLIIDYIKSAY